MLSVPFSLRIKSREREAIYLEAAGSVEIENRKKYILQFKKDCLLFDEEIEDRNRILKMIDEYRNKYSYRLGVYFNYQTKYNY